MKIVFYLFAIIALCACRNNQETTDSDNQNDSANVEHTVSKKAASNSLKYDTIFLSGIVVEKTGYLNEKKEPYFALNLNKSYNVIEDKDDEMNSAEKNVNTIQMVGDYTKMKDLLGKKVTVKGGLFHADNGHHHEKVLMDVKEIHLLK